MNILLTGGAGFIGSHTAIALNHKGHKVILMDNFCNSSPSVLERLRQVLGHSLPCIEGDVRNIELVKSILSKYQIDAVVHFAGLKAVGDSSQIPIQYYSNNVEGSISLLDAMKSTNVKRLVFSSSATVYGDPKYLPIDENHPVNATNPYGRTKQFVEEMLRDVSMSTSGWKIVCLRYFNPVGAHESGMIGEHPSGTPNNLMPLIAKVAIGKIPNLTIYGNNYATIDGTGVRDYIHIMDLAEGHVAAIERLDYLPSSHSVVNLGTGKGASVLELIKLYNHVSGRKIPFQIGSNRAGDIAACYANADKAYKVLGWVAKRTMREMCEDSWRWQLTLKNQEGQ